MVFIYTQGIIISLTRRLPRAIKGAAGLIMPLGVIHLRVAGPYRKDIIVPQT